MNLKVYIVAVIAIFTQKVIAVPVSTEDAPSDDLSEEQIRDEIEFSEFGFHLTLSELNLYLLEEAANLKKCYLAETGNYKEAVNNYIKTIEKAASKLKTGVPKAQVKIVEKMAKYPIKLQEKIESQTFEQVEEFIWSVSDDVSHWLYELHVEMRKLKEKSYNESGITNYEEKVIQIEKETESEMKDIVDKILKCVNATESNF